MGFTHWIDTVSAAFTRTFSIVTPVLWLEKLVYEGQITNLDASYRNVLFGSGGSASDVGWIVSNAQNEDSNHVSAITVVVIGSPISRKQRNPFGADCLHSVQDVKRPIKLSLVVRRTDKAQAQPIHACTVGHIPTPSGFQISGCQHKRIAVQNDIARVAGRSSSMKVIAVLSGMSADVLVCAGLVRPGTA